MGLIRNNPVSTLDFTEISRVLSSLFDLHESRSSDCTFWPELETTWDNLIADFDSIKDFSAVGTMKSVRILKNAETIRETHSDPHIRSAARLVYGATVNQITSGNLSAIIEDFCLNAYRRAPFLIVRNNYQVWLGCYSWIERFIRGNPSPSRITSDWNQAVKDLITTEIIAISVKDGVIFQINMNRGDDDKLKFCRDMAFIMGGNSE